MQLVLPARPLQPWADGNGDCDATLKSTTVRPEPPTTLPYPPGKYPSSRLHAHQASRPGNSSDVPSDGRENCVDPSKRHPPDFHHHHRPPPARAYLHGISCLQIRTTGGTCPSFLTTLSTSRCPPPEPSLPAAPSARSLTFEILGVAPRRPVLVSSGQRGDTREVVTHGIRPQGIRHSQRAAEAGQERRYRAQVCVRAPERAAGGGPRWGCGRGRAGRSSPPSLWAPRSSAGPARREGPRASWLPACHCLWRGRGRGPREGP